MLVRLHCLRNPLAEACKRVLSLHCKTEATTDESAWLCLACLPRSCWFLLSLTGSCNICRIAAQDDQLWKRLCYQKFSPPRSAPCKNWKALYRYFDRDGTLKLMLLVLVVIRCSTLQGHVACRFNHSLLHQVISQTKQTKPPFFMPSQGSIRINVPVFA